MTLNSREQEEILKASREKNVFFMEVFLFNLLLNSLFWINL